MKRTITLFLLLSGLASQAGSSKHGPTFTQKDVFQTSFFLKNVPGLISDCHDQPVRYFADHDGITVFLTDAGPVYKLTGMKDAKTGAHKEGKSMRTSTSYISVKWIGANPHPEIEASGKTPGYYTYLAGHSGKELHSIITEGYGKITYQDLYPGIDVEYSFPDKGGMKYNLIVHPGADIHQIKMQYDGAIKTVGKDQDGNITVHTENGDIIEHAPISYTDGGQPVTTIYDIQNQTISFLTPQGYDHHIELTIDPWVTVISNLSINNLGVSVDYDSLGDVYVYGAGGANCLNLTHYHELAKYDSSGNPLWVFMGSVPAISWNTVDGTPANYLANIMVDKITNKVYVNAAFNNGGVHVIRLTSAGNYDNFVTMYPDSNFTDIWSYLPSCFSESILALGSSTDSFTSLGFIDTVSGVITAFNYTHITTTRSYSQDIVSGTYDAYGNLYTVMASYATTSVNNVMYRVSNTYSGYIWTLPSGYSSFSDIGNIPAFGGFLYGSGNNFNGLAANASYLYYYDGHNLKAFDLANGNTVGTPTTLPGYTALWQGGIVVDNCNHIYLGGKGAIKTFSFDGSTFTAGPDIPLGAGFAGDTILDVKYDPITQLLLVTGPHIVGTYPAVFSDSCSGAAAVAHIFTASLSTTCHSAIVQVTSLDSLASPVFSFVWKDMAGNIIRQTQPDSILTDSFTAPDEGRYTVQVILSVGCYSYSITDSMDFDSSAVNIAATDTAICSGLSTMLTAVTNSGGGSYLWSPGGDTTRSITVSPSNSGTYSVSYTTACGVGADSVFITVYPLIKPTAIDTAICQGQSFILDGSSYDSTGIYTKVLSSTFGCDSAIVLTLTVTPLSHDTITQSICSGDSFVFGGVVYYNSGTYDQSLTSMSGCDSITTLMLTVLPLSYDTVDERICPGDSALFGGAEYYSPGYYSQTYSGSNGCDSISTLHLILKPLGFDTFTRSICQGDSFAFGGNIYRSAGYYSETLSGSNGCDSISTLHLIVRPIIADTFAQSICNGDSITFGGAVYHAPGFYSVVLTDSYGCDSTSTLQLTLRSLSFDTITANICRGDSFDFGGTYYSGPGVYNQVLTGSNGCDSNVTLLLTVNALPVIHWQQQDSIESCTHSTGLIALPAGGHYTGPYVSGDSIIDPPADTSFAVTYTYTDSDGCLATDMQRFVTGICTGIADIGENSGIRLYPNPNNGSFILRSNDCIGSEYTVYDMIGRMIARGTITADIQNISLIGIAMGSYTLEVKGNKAIRFVIGNG